MDALLALRQSLQTATEEYQALQIDLSNVVEMRQRLDAQLSENELVKKVRTAPYCPPRICPRTDEPEQEFASLTPANTVYKLVGPVLVQQDQAEAKQNVDTRLDFIRSEMCVPTLSHPLTSRSRFLDARTQ